MRLPPRFTILPLAAALLLAGGTVGCVETKRTQKSMYGSPTSVMQGPKNEFDAENYQPYKREPKPWYRRIFD